MGRTTGDVIVETLADWGVDTVFGLPGDGVDGVMESLRTHRDGVRFIQVRHEEAAAFMACAYAKYTGRLGACVATSGPGGLHLLNGLYDAKFDGAPVVAITGMPHHDLLGTQTQQDVPLDRVFQDVAVYSERVMGPAHARNVIDLACRRALAYRGVGHVTVPIDIQSMEVSDGHRSARNLKRPLSEDWAPPAAVAREDELRAAAELIDGGTKTVILAGQGALGATDELLALSEILAAPIVKALLGKAAVPDDDPHTTGGIGLLGTRPSQDAMEECDTLVIVGSSFPYTEFYPEPGKARAVQIDIDPARIGLRFPVDAGVVGDAKHTLRALLPRLRKRNDRSFLQKAQERMREWNGLMNERASRMDTPMKPQVFADAIGRHLADDAIVSCDSGTIATWYARHIPARRGQRFSLSGTLATMGNGLPYAIAAQIAYPKRQCVALVGDGGFSMLMAEFMTAVKYDLPVKIFINKNNVLGQIRWEQMVFLGNPEYGVELHPIDYAAYARACGGTGFTIEDPRTCADVVAEAMRVDGPVVVEGVVDQFEPPMPARIEPKQALRMAEALARGEPNREKIAMTVGEDIVRETI